MKESLQHDVVPDYRKSILMVFIVCDFPQSFMMF